MLTWVPGVREQIQVLRHEFPYMPKTDILLLSKFIFILLFLKMGSFLEIPYLADSQYLSEQAWILV